MATAVSQNIREAAIRGIAGRSTTESGRRAIRRPGDPTGSGRMPLPAPLFTARKLAWFSSRESDRMATDPVAGRGAVVLAGPLRGRQRATTLLPNSSRKLCGSQYRGCGLTDGLFQLADCLRSVADVEFVEDALQVVLHGEAADTENHPDF